MEGGACACTHYMILVRLFRTTENIIMLDNIRQYCLILEYCPCISPYVATLGLQIVLPLEVGNALILIDIDQYIYQRADQ